MSGAVEYPSCATGGVSVRRTHLPSFSIEGDGVRLLGGHHGLRLLRAQLIIPPGLPEPVTGMTSLSESLGLGVGIGVTAGALAAVQVRKARGRIAPKRRLTDAPRPPGR